MLNAQALLSVQRHGHSSRGCNLCRATASSVAEAKDAELEKVLASNARLRQDLASLQHVRMVCALSASTA